jgi:hypothetical protein
MTRREAIIEMAGGALCVAGFLLLIYAFAIAFGG